MTDMTDITPIPEGTIPESIPQGQILVHFRPPPSAHSQVGAGCQAWTQTGMTYKGLEFEGLVCPCRCGWSGLPHYSIISSPMPPGTE
jgi:hypothetical protein